eukprot:g17222.t1
MSQSDGSVSGGSNSNQDRSNGRRGGMNKSGSEEKGGGEEQDHSQIPCSGNINTSGNNLNSGTKGAGGKGRVSDAVSSDRAAPQSNSACGGGAAGAGGAGAGNVPTQQYGYPAQSASYTRAATSTRENPEKGYIHANNNQSINGPRGGRSSGYNPIRGSTAGGSGKNNNKHSEGLMTRNLAGGKNNTARTNSSCATTGNGTKGPQVNMLPSSQMADQHHNVSDNQVSNISSMLGKPLRKRPDTSGKFLCTYILGLKLSDPFDVAKRIIGPDGHNVKYISHVVQGCKVRLRGERFQNEDDDAPCQLNVSVPTKEGYLIAKHLVHILLDRIFQDYYAYSGGICRFRPRVNCSEHPLNEGICPQWERQYKQQSPWFKETPRFITDMKHAREVLSNLKFSK